METKKLLEPNNGWQNVGRMYQFAESQMLSGSELSVYMCIVQRTVGYCQSVSNELSIKSFIDITGLSNKTVSNSINSLIEKNLIKRIKTNQGIGAKIPSKYSIVFQHGIDMKLNSNVITTDKDIPEWEKIKNKGF